MSAEKPWRDKETLKYLYWERGYPSSKVGDLLGCTPSCIRKWMIKHDIPRRTAPQDKFGCFHTDGRGYERFSVREFGKRNVVRIHRLVAVAEYGYSDVEDMDVHHDNNIPWDNRPENLKVMTTSEHQSKHMTEKWESEEWRKRRSEMAKEQQKDGNLFSPIS